MCAEFPSQIPSSGVVGCHIPCLPLVAGEYKLTVGCRGGGGQLDFLEDAARLWVQETDYFGTGTMPREGQGLVLVRAQWSPQP
jgi:hypothetical protein